MTVCKRCGTCCRKGGPALHVEDLPLVREKKIALGDLVTLRAGELAHDQVRGQVAPLTREIVKLRGVGGVGTCAFYDEENSGCAIYGHRPLECRLLFCGDTTALAEAYDKGRVTRFDLVDPESGLGGIMADHQREVPLEEVPLLARAMNGGDLSAAGRLAGMVEYDLSVRKSLAERAGLSENELSFLFGRPLADLLPGFGLRLARRGGKTLLQKA